MRELERRFPRELAVVGVHSGKYIAERVTPRIARAAERLGVHHAIVNDRQFRTWRGYAVRAWPTLVLIDPRGLVIGMQAGEMTADDLTESLAPLVQVAAANGDLVLADATAERAPPAPAADTGLRYPGKVAVSPPDAQGRRRLAIADSGRHRVVVGTLAPGGRRLHVEQVVGRGVPTWAHAGLAPQGSTRTTLAERADGAADAASFDMPQGLAFDGDTLWVADAGNHAVRAVDLATGTVRTVAGTGARVRTRDDQRAGAMASPWDVAVGVGGALWVAMAGTHQLWRLERGNGFAAPHAGGRGEDIVDGPLREALLAQPMALALDASGGIVFADAESSAVRVADVADGGAVRTLVGTGLFDFGDHDDVGDAVRLQHAQGLAVHPDGRVLVADSYNDALKWLDPTTRRVTTWVRDLHEPGGVALADGLAYVADTDAHRIAVVDERGTEVEELTILW